MPDNENLVNALIESTIPKLQPVAKPVVSDLVSQRRRESLIPVVRPDTRLPYRTYEDTAENFIYDPTDFDTVRELIKANVAKAIEDRFPIIGDKYTLSVENLAYEKPKTQSLSEEKDVIQHEKSLMDRLRGTWVLRDTATGDVVERKNATLLNVPRLTSRGTFIRNGSELGLKHMFRLKPGIYARVKGDGTPSVHINPAQTTGRQMSINMDNNTGVMTIARGTRTYGVLPMLIASGVPEEQIERAWGKELFDMNKAKYQRLISNPEQMAEYRKLWDTGLSTIKLDPETTELTMGKAYTSMQPETLLGAANKVVRLARSMSVDDEDDRDSMVFQRVMGPADYIPERIIRDGGGLLRKMFQRVIRDGNLNSIESGAFQPQVDSVFTEDKHAGYIDGSSPFESLDFASSITRIGEGGIGSLEAAPAETRGVNDSYLGFVSPIRSVESARVGLDGYMTYGVLKDTKGNLYARFIDKNGTNDYRPMGVVAKSVVTTPEFFDPNGDPEEFIPAFNKGKGLEYVPRKDVDYYLASSNNMMSIGEGMIPNIGGIRSNRTLMGCLHPDTEIRIIRDGVPTDIKASDLLNRKPEDKVISIDFSNNAVCFRDIRGVHKVDPKPCKKITTMFGTTAVVSSDHKWITMQDGADKPITTDKLICKAVPMAPVWNENFNSSVSGALHNDATDNTYNLWVWDYVTEVVDSDYTGYLIDLDVDDSVYMLSNGLFTHNSKYNQQALPLENRETPLVQREIITADGDKTTSEKVVAKHLGAKFSPVNGRVVSVTPDDIVIRDNDGVKHTIDLYNMYPANQKGFLHNTPAVEPGQAVTAGQLLADSNYTRDGSAALGTNLHVAFMSGHGAENFEDAIAISESAAKKLASEQMYKFKGDLTPDTTYSKQKYLSLFGDGDYTQEQLDKIDDNGLPKVGVQFRKGDPIFLGTQIRDLSTSGLSRNSAVPYVKTWEHSAPGTVVDVVKGRKHLTVYTRSFTPMQIGDKMCYDDKTEVLTKRGWVLFQDLLAEDEVLTLDIRTMETFFSGYEAAFKYYCDKELIYRLTSKRLDIAVTRDHRHVVAAMNNARYIDFQTSDQIYGKQRWFLTNDNFDKSYCYASSREDGANERWEKYTGYVYCINVPRTHTMFVRRNGKTMWSGNSGRYGSKGIVSCYPSTYNIMCEDGIKPIKDLTTDDKVAVFDPKTETAHFEHPVAVQHYDYNGDLFGYESKHLEWLVTPNHGMWCKSSHDNHKRHPENAFYRRKEASAIYGTKQLHRIAAPFPQACGNKQTFRLPDFIEYRSNAKNTIDTFSIDDFACFLGIWIAEGSLTCNDIDTTPQKGCGKHYVVITQKEDSKDPESSVRCRRIEALLSRMGLCYSRSGIRYAISHKGLCAYLKRFGKSKDKYIPQEVFTDWPRSAQQNLLDWYYMGDGDKAWARHDLRATTSSASLRDDLCRLGAILGYAVKWTLAKEPSTDKDGYKHNYSWRISFSRRFESESRNNKQYEHAYRRGYYVEHYEGQVHCCTVSTGVILVAKEGKFMWCGNSIIPDDQMVRDAEGKPYDVILSPLSLPSRLNTAMLGELQLSKVAKLLGHPIAVPDFLTDDTIDSYAKKMLDKYGLKETTTVYDPRSGKYVDDVSDGYIFHFKLKHMAELKERSRGTGLYSSEDVPLKGEGAARRLGMMETSAVYSGGGMDVLRDAKLLRGQRNDEFWKAYRNGENPEIPGTPLVHKKFFSHLLASGANIDPQPDGSFKLGAATNKDIFDLTGNREVTQASTFDSKNMHPIQGGLFDPNIFGDEGDQWGYYQLPEPVLNPLMFKPIANIMGWTDTELREYLQGMRKIGDKFGPEALIDKLKAIDLKAESRKAKALLKSGRGTLQQRDLARKRIRAIDPLLEQGLKPEDLFFTRLPILPPRFRAVTVIKGGETNIAADANFLYKKAIDAADDLKEAIEKLPGEFQTDARESLYNAVNALVGTMPTDDPKLEAKGVGGLLKWAFGKSSPKLSSTHRKIFGSNLDMGSLSTIIPDSRLKLDQVGIPLESAWKMYEPFVVRDLRQNGYSMVRAMKEVLDKSPEAEKSLREVMSKRPLLLNRAPTLWRYGIQGLYPVPVDGTAIRVNPAICKNYNADFDGNCCDFDSKIFLKISKSALDFINNRVYIDGNANRQPTEEKKMSVTKNEAVFAKVPKEGLQLVSIGEFPRIGEPIKDKNGADVYGLPSGVEILTVDPKSGEHCFKEASTLTVEEDCDCVEVVIGGRKAVVSTNATLAVFDPEHGTLVKVAADEHNGRLVPVLRKMPIAFGSMYDRDLGWWLGALLSDGWISDRMIGYTKLEDVKRAEFVRIARNICDNFTANEYRSKAGEKKLGESVKVHLFGKDLVEACKKFDIYASDDQASDGRSSLRKQIPYDLILNGSEKFLYGLLSGLLDGDGSLVKNMATGTPRFNCRFSTSSPQFRETFEFLLYRLGIRSSTTVTPPRNWSNEAYTISPSTVDMFKVLDKLTCIGERERNIIEEWKQHPSKKDDIDLVPISNEELKQLRAAGLAHVDKSLYSALGRPSRSCARATAMKRIEFIEKNAPSFAQRVKNTNTDWRPVSSIKAVGKRQVFDFAIPDTKVFVINAGVTIYDSMTTHVPVSETAIKAMDKSMLPSRNLLSPKDFKAHYIPRDAANEGLFLASRVGAGDPVRFKTEAEAEAAYKRGEIKIDTPIVIG